MLQTRRDQEILSSESFGDFTEVLSHRMGSLLASIEGHTELLVPGLTSTEDRLTALHIRESVSRINGMLRELGDYRNSLTATRRPMEARHVLQTALLQLTDTEAARIRMDVRITPGFLIEVDERLICQALIAVLRNAFEAGRSHAETVTLRVRSVDNAACLQLLVHSESYVEGGETRRRLFQPFYTTKAANLGLGLTIARRIFRAHGGDIELLSTDPDHGTEFGCRLPRHG